LDDPTVLARIAADRALSERLPIRGTPSFFVSGRRTFLAHVATIEEEFVQAQGGGKALLQRGVPRDQVVRRATSEAVEPD
jgi:hypothetical protein